MPQESKFNGLVWVVEKNHEPIIKDGRIVSFPCGGTGTMEMRKYLNTLYSEPNPEFNYYDAVLYERKAKP